MNSVRLVDFGVMTSMMEVKDNQVSCALTGRCQQPETCQWEELDILINGTEQQDLGHIEL